MQLPCYGSMTMLPSMAALLILLFQCVQQSSSVSMIPRYTGPRVCKGTRPLFVDTDYLDADGFSPKAYFEPYWEQFYQHVVKCQIIVGNLIIPHMRAVPFELNKITEAVKDIIEVTGFIYIYDTEVDITFKSLIVIHGNELLKYPWKTATNEQNKDELFALFFDRVRSKSISFPKLKYIKRGKIGFKSTPYLCVYQKKGGTVNVAEWFDSKQQRQYDDVVKIFQNVGSKEVPVFSKCSEEKKPICNECEQCFGPTPSDCQTINRKKCSFCKRASAVLTCAGEAGKYMCCESSCRGGCIVGHQDDEDLSLAQCVACNDNQYLLWETSDQLKRKCVDFCDGLIIEEAKICLHKSKTNVCPDYMFKHSFNKCSYQCPKGMEFDPVANMIDEETTAAYKNYWDGKIVCKPCRMRFVNNDFANDCGIGCALPHSSLSYFSILNIVPEYDDMSKWTISAFRAIMDNNYEYARLKKCRHLYGVVKIDQYSVGYPQDKVRLSSRYFDMLTEATGLYGMIVVENTEGFWYVDMFRNLVVIAAPQLSDIHPTYTESVLVEYNSDLRTLDLQRLKKYDGTLVVRANPLYITPRNPEKPNEPVFFNGEVIEDNGQIKTRSQRDITYNTGCKDSEGNRIKAYYYKRCVKCAENEFRVSKYIPQWRQLFFTCIPERECVTKRTSANQVLYYKTNRYDERVCIKCNEECNYQCSDETPFTCLDKDNKDLDCVNNKIDQFNLLVCAPAICPKGFYQHNKRCVACDSACRTCSGPGNDVSGSQVSVMGCIGCGIIYVQTNYKGDLLRVKCMNVGYKYRIAPEDEATRHNGFKRIWDAVPQQFPDLSIVPSVPKHDRD